MAKNLPNLDSPATLKGVNAHLKARGLPYELVKGSGYLYFVGGDTNVWADTSVMVPRANCLTVRAWLEALDELRADYAHRLMQATPPSVLLLDVKVN